MSNIRLAYRNLVELAITVTESSGTTDSTNYGTSNIYDYDLNTSFRTNGKEGALGTNNVIFDFGSSVYADSAICVHSLPSDGTLYLKAGGTNPPTDMTWNLSIASDTGTAVYWNANAASFRYWQLFMAGKTQPDAYHEIHELFIGKRVTLGENPAYPFNVTDDDDVTMLQSGLGQRYAYRNFRRRTWEMDFPAIQESTLDQLLALKNNTRGGAKPFWFCFDVDDDPNDLIYARLSRGFKYTELISGFYDTTISFEEEL